MNVNVIDLIVIGSALDELFHNGIFLFLLALTITDFITGTIKAIMIKDVNSSTGLNGLLRTTAIMVVVIVTSVTIIIAGYNEFMYIMISFYIFEYVISIIENLDKMGIPFPEKLVKILRQWEESKKEKGGH